MHAAERDRLILGILEERRFVSFRDLAGRLSTSAATLRRDLDRLDAAGRLKRVRGGAQIAGEEDANYHLHGIPFHENIHRNRPAKEAIARAAAALCQPEEAVIIDGGSTTLQMCPHLEHLKLQVLTNSLHIVSALLQQPSTGVLIPGGVVFREQNIVLDPFSEISTRSFHAKRMFVSTAAVSRHGLMQTDIILVQAERKLLNLADQLVVLVDSSKFDTSAGHLMCDFTAVDTLITDSGIDQKSIDMVKEAGVELIVVDA
jgi:DeoR family ulaG and ulaABCDEF operon transcriptional repressor